MAVTVQDFLAPTARRWRGALVAGRARVAARVRRTSRIARARAGYAVGAAATAWGVGVEFGFGWALMVGGVVTSASFLLLYDVDGSP
jgi:hypothetical protein